MTTEEQFVSWVETCESAAAGGHDVILSGLLSDFRRVVVRHLDYDGWNLEDWILCQWQVCLNQKRGAHYA